MTIDHNVFETLPAEDLSNILPRILDGDILLCAATDLGSRVISWSTRSCWTHVAMAYRWSSLGRIMAFESVHTIGVRSIPLATFIERTSSGVTPYPGKIILARHEEFSRRLQEQPDAVRRLGDFAVDRFGDPFASKEILKIAGRVILGRVRTRMPKPLAPENEFICSEYVAKCLETAGVTIGWDGAGFVAPADIARDPGVRAIAQFDTRALRQYGRRQAKPSQAKPSQAKP